MRRLKLKEYLKSVRPLASVFPGLLTLAAFRIASGSSRGAWGLAGAVVIISMAIMAQNDLRDRRHDAKKGKCFVLENERSFKWFVTILWLAAGLAAWKASAGNVGYELLLGFMIVGGLLYSEVHAVPMLPNTTVALMYISPALLPLFVYPHGSFTCWSLFLGMAPAVFGREMLKDFDDRAIDPGYKWTLLQRVGPQQSLLIIWSLFVASMLVVNFLSLMIVLPVMFLFTPYKPSIEALSRALGRDDDSAETIVSVKLLMDIGMTLYVLMLILSPPTIMPPEWIGQLATLVWGCVFCFLIGGIPYSWLAVWWFGPRDEQGRRQDLRLLGSGNVGATNAMRQLGLAWYPLLIVLDAGKAVAAMAIGSWLFPGNEPAVLGFGLIATVGHCFPIYLSFQGGKGFACTLGILAFGGHSVLMLISWGVWLGVLTLARIWEPKLDQRVWLASVASTVALPLLAWIFTKDEATTSLLATLAILLIFCQGAYNGQRWEWQLPRFDIYDAFFWACDRLWGKPKPNDPLAQ